ncbi:hypothetical protein HCN44_005261 [Aphidius gifuensis]|uniref:Carboxylic ester hydrolase n=1 Tax=Aphidius gifuensis TaxID=684658 RepID=A0A834Y4E7_APHGI|nr:hypothetical protein HCN44_005261 [Aphidius gifuensis]
MEVKLNSSGNNCPKVWWKINIISFSIIPLILMEHFMWVFLNIDSQKQESLKNCLNNNSSYEYILNGLGESCMIVIDTYAAFAWTFTDLFIIVTERLQYQLEFDNVVLTGLNFFELTRSFMLGPPVEADAWTKILNATLEASSCPQISEQTGQYSGDEDCLYLNVYTPKISFNETVNDELLAVMVWIYGGGFLAGEIKENFYGPDFLVADNVVVVAMNYRLGALGFLSLDIPEATGNMGLKDQLLALKWVKKNIQKFGGDPKKVTIFGESAGSDSVMLHQLSPASRGLFRGAIGMSGSPLNPWGFAPLSLAVTLAFDFAKYLGINSSNKTQVFNEINALSAEILAVTATDMYFHSNIKGYKVTSFVPFVPTCENPKIAKDIFITESPLRTYESGKFSIIPVILGFTNEEMLSFFPVDIPSISTALNNVIESKIKDIYLLDESIVFSAINITSNLNFVAGIDSTQQYLTKHSSTVFYYKNSFDYEESMHIIKGINFTGTGHADDLGHFFWQPVMNQNSDPNSRIGIHRTQIIRLWTNFVKYLNPTPSDTKDPLINFTWIPSGTEGLHLEIGNEQFVMKTRPTDETTKAIQASANAFDHADCIN